MNAKRRDLKFQSLSEVMPDVDRLLERGYTSVGNWTLGEVCNHLALMIQGSVEGFQYRAPWPLRKFVAPFVFRSLLKNRAMPECIKVSKSMLPKSNLDDRAEAEALRATIGYYQMQTGEPAEHPFFGKISAADWRSIHEIHCSHHLSFLQPA